MLKDFYSLIAEDEDKSEDLKANILALFDKLLQEGNLNPVVAAKIVKLRSTLLIEF